MASLSDHLTSAAEAAANIERKPGLSQEDQAEYDRLRKLAEDLDLEAWVLSDYVGGER